MSVDRRFSPPAQDRTHEPTASVGESFAKKKIGKNTLTLSGVGGEKPPAKQSGHRPVPARPWGVPKQARNALGKWWGVKRIFKNKSEEATAAHHGPIFRHATLESAQREAEYLAHNFPGTCFVVIETVSFHLSEPGETEQ